MAHAENAFGPDSKARMESELSGFEAAHSTGYLGQFYFEVSGPDGRESGFGSLRESRPHHPEDDRKTYEIFLNGRVFKPEQTQKVVANGITGTPTQQGWEFEVESGRIKAFAIHPEGLPVRTSLAEVAYDLRSDSGKSGFLDKLKPVPEAYAHRETDLIGAIRYFNAAPEGEFVAHPEYAQGLEWRFDRGLGGYSDTLAHAFAERLALNPNDLPAMGMQAQSLCHEGKIAEAEQAMQAAERIRPDYYRIPLARAGCLEKQGRRKEANAQIQMALHSDWIENLPERVERMDGNDREDKYDSAYAVQARKVVWLEWDFVGLGIPQAALGSSLSLHANLGSFATSLSIGTGIAQFNTPKSPFPAANLRLYSPGRKFRGYLGFGVMNPFGAGPRGHIILFGPEAGLSHDIGGPRGLKAYYGLTYITGIVDHPKEDNPARSSVVLPHLSMAYAF